jgi:hypothetical protein
VSARVVVLALALALALPAGARRAGRAPAIVNAKANATQVRVGDSFQLDVEIRVFTGDDPKNVELPKLDGLKLVRQERGPTRQQTSIVNGAASYEKSFNYHLMLEATEPGNRTVGAIRVLVGSYQALSRPIQIRVLDPAAVAEGSGRSSALDPGVRFAEGEPPPYFIDLRFDHDEAYVGEQVILTLQIFAKDYIDPDTRQLQPPKPPGFWVEELERESRVRPTERVVGGTRYFVYRFWRLALFPLEAGEREMPPMNLGVEVTGKGWRNRQKLTLRSDPVILVVNPLPDKDRPADFQSANVGDYQLRASVEPRKTTVGEPVTLKIEASGFGNVGALKLPALDLEDARVFPPTTSERKSVDGGRLFGVKGLEVLVQPQREGELQVPAFSLSYFEPIAGRYRVARTKPISVPVGKARARVDDSGLNLIAKRARPVKRGLSPARVEVTYASPIFFGLIGLIALLGGGLFALLRKLEANARSGRRKAAKAARARRADLASAREEKDLAAAERVVRDALAAAFPGSRAHATSPEVEAIVAERDPKLGRDVAAWLDRAAAAAYGKAGARKPLFDDADALLDRLEDA